MFGPNIYNSTKFNSCTIFRCPAKFESFEPNYYKFKAFMKFSCEYKIERRFYDEAQFLFKKMVITLRYESNDIINTEEFVDEVNRMKI